MLVIGLTGGIGSGKSTIAAMFERLQVPVIDTDIIARQLVEPGMPALDDITQEFGNVLHQDGSLDRTKLRNIVFSDENQRLKLEAILHPRIREAVLSQLQQLETQATAYAIVVIPLLFKKQDWPVLDRVLLVECHEQQQIRRVTQRDGLTEQQTRAIIASQPTNQQRINMADDIIENNQDTFLDTSILEQQVQNLDKKYRALAIQ